MTFIPTKRSSLSRRALWNITTALVLLAIPSRARAEADTFARTIKPFLVAHCVKCHGPDRQSGDVRLDDLQPEAARDAQRWSAVRDQIRDGLMPPAKQPRPDNAQARTVVAWATALVGARPGRMPNEGNLIPHELLFGKPATVNAAPPPRVWRLSPEGYFGFVRDVSRGRMDGLVQPFTLVPERGIKDFAGLYTIDEPSTEILLRNAARIVETQTAHEIKDGKLRGKNDSIREFVTLMDPARTPAREQLEAVVQKQFQMAIGREAPAEEVARYLALYERCARIGDRPAAVKTMLQAVLLKSDAMFRSELGRGQPDGNGRRLLAPDELARAISLALGHRRDSRLMQAADKGELTSREQAAAHVRRILEEPKADRSRLLGFFREYFEYDRALDIFKDKPNTFIHAPGWLVSDTDHLVLHILDEDKDVFRRLLITPESFVNYKLNENKKTRKRDIPARGVIPPKARKEKGQKQIEGVEYVYGISSWPEKQPAVLPKNTRLGILMQPSWLVSWSTNFDNDPVRRGRWIRERLLGGTVPDLPIGVAAQVPDDPHRTFRDRLTVTRAPQCWKCHQKMDDLGLPFENFDHYGRFRTTETVRDLEATAKNVDKKGKPLGPVTHEVSLNTTGQIADSGDPRLDGAVQDPRDLVLRLAASERVRQVFIRHVFRYFLGRNETLADARTLQEADRAYVQSGGSFKTLVVSLLTSDSFLYRSLPSSGGSSK